MSRGALLTGTVGGILGTITAAVGIIWVFIYIILLSEIYNYLGELGAILSTLVPWMAIPDYTGPWPIPIFPSWSLFGVFSYILAIFLIVTGILISIGFYGMYKIGGGAMGVVGLIFGIIGSTLGALLIIIGNTTTGYMYAKVMVEMATVDYWPVTTPNFQIIWLGFVVLGLTFIISSRNPEHHRRNIFYWRPFNTGYHVNYWLWPNVRGFHTLDGGFLFFQKHVIF